MTTEEKLDHAIRLGELATRMIDKLLAVVEIAVCPTCHQQKPAWIEYSLDTGQRHQCYDVYHVLMAGVKRQSQTTSKEAKK